MKINQILNNINNKFKSKKIKIITISLLIVIFISLLFNAFKSSNNKNYTEKDVKKVKTDITNRLEDTFTSPTSTKEEIEEVIGYDITSSNLIIGKDAYIRKNFDEKTIAKYNLQDYVNKQNAYADRIEKEYLENLKVTLGQTAIYEQTEIYQEVKVISFYYGLYRGDLYELTSLIFQQKKPEALDESDIQAGSEEDIEYYKSKVEAMGILDKHFDTYVNREEELSVEIIYKDGKPKNSDEAFTLLCNLTGITYENAWFATEEVQKAQQERLDGYLKEWLQVE